MSDKLPKIFWFVFLFILGSAGVLFILPHFWSRVIFALFMIVILGWTVRSGQKTDINTLGLITAYVLSVAQFGLRLYFPNQVSAWMVVAATFVWTFLLFWLGFKIKVGYVSGSAKVLGLVAGLSAGEIALGLLFWPTHFLVTSTVFFLLFYLAWMTANFYMFGLLNWHRILIHLIFVGAVLSIVLFTAQWTIS